MNIDEYLTLAEIEDNLWHARSRLAHVERALKRVISPGRPARVLDAGCGNGGLMLRLGQRYPNWDWSGPQQDAALYYRLGRSLAMSSAWPNWHRGDEFRLIRDKSRGGK